MKIKDIERTANFCWSPQELEPVYLACGTAALQVDASFNTASKLELFRFNPEEVGLDCETVASVNVDSRFNKVAWSCAGMKEGSHPSGLLVGGLENGVVSVWDAAKLIMEESDVQINKLEKHTGPVTALDFNNFQNNLLASGSVDSDILLWDLNSPSTPMTPGAKSQPAAQVSCLAWNCQVQHILASAFDSRCIIWDLRKSEPIVKISDSMSRIRANSVVWHPDVATQLILASADDQTPVMQLWDLRFASAALKVLERHEKGILSASWNKADSDILLSSGRDNKLICWNPNSDQTHGQVTFELPLGSAWCYETAWCPRNPHCIAASSSTGHITTYSVMGGEMTTQQAVPSNKIMDSFGGFEDLSTPQTLPKSQQIIIPQITTTPKWLKRPCGANFAFGGKLISFTNSKSKDPNQPPLQSNVQINQVVTEDSLVAQSHQLEVALHNKQFLEFCSMKISNSNSQQEQVVWKFLKVNFESEPRSKCLGILGLDSQEIQSKIAASGLISQPEEDNPVTPDIASDEPSDAFDKISLQSKQTEASGDIKPAGPLTFKRGDDVDGMLTSALLSGNFEMAVDICMTNGREADAIILANADGPALLERTMTKYFKSKQNSNTSQLISTVVNKDYQEAVELCSLECWKEIFALILTYAQPGVLSQLCDTLGDRMSLSSESSICNNALLCYICSGNVDKFVNCWTKQTKEHSNPESLQDLVEKVMMLKKSVEILRGQELSIKSDGLLADKLGAYSQLLAQQGSLKTALTYLSGTAGSNKLSILKHRLEKSLGVQAGAAPWPQQQNAQPIQQSAGKDRHRSSSSGYDNTTYPTHNTQNTYSQKSVSNNYYANQPNTSTYSSYNGSTYGASTTTTTNPSYETNNSPSAYNPVYTNNPTSTYNPTAGSATQYMSAATTYNPTSSYQAGTYSSYGGTSGYQNTGVQYSSNTANTGYGTGYGQGNAAGYGQTNMSFGTGYQQPAGKVAARGLLSKKYASSSGDTAATSAAPVTTVSQTASFYNPATVNTATVTPAPTNVFQPSPSTYQPPPPVLPNVDEVRAAPAGWNDPPPVKSKTPEPKTVSASQPMPGVYNPNEHQPQYTSPPQAYGFPQQPMVHQPQQPTAGYPQQPTAAYQQQYQQQYQQPAPISPPITPTAPPAPLVKEPIPENHIVLQETLDTLAKKCLQTSQNPQQKKKLEEVLRKLEMLYDKLRNHALSENILNGLHQIVQSIKTYDYQTGLSLHTNLVMQGNFSEISAFMPGIKMLMQTALQLQVFI